jgi:SAM-dependent methyltransferase
MADYIVPNPRDAVIDIYRAILQREPDPGGLASFAGMLGKQGLRPVLRQFLESSEYRSTLVQAPPSRELSLAGRMEVELNLSDQELDRLWDHVSAVWTELGNADPFWSVLTNERYKRANLTDDAIIEEFYATGSWDFSYLKAYLDRAELTLTPDMVVAEYGCGVGRVTPFFARAAGSVLAFDISLPHLHAARNRLDRESISNVELVHVEGRGTLNKLSNIDLFYSVIVLQHNPPPIILGILDAAFSGLTAGGIAFFQVPTYAKGYDFKLSEYLMSEALRKSMEMHFVPQTEILRLGKKHGLELLEIRSDDLIGNYSDWLSNTFLMRKG